MQPSPTTKSRTSVVASLQESVRAAFKEYGPCELPLPKGTLRITDMGDGGIRVGGVSARGNTRFEFLLKNGEVTYVPPTHRDGIRASYGGERQFLSRLDDFIRTALARNKISPLSYPKDADPLRASLGQRVTSARPLSLQDEIAAAWGSVNRILTAPDGKQLPKSVSEIDSERGRPDYYLHIRRGTDPGSLVLEMISTSYRRETLMDDRVIIKPDSIVYHLADSGEPFKDERYALDQLQDWLARREKALSSSKNKTAQT